MSKIVRKAFKYRMYPNKEQQEKLQWTLVRCCELYNNLLSERRSIISLHFLMAYHLYPKSYTGNIKQENQRALKALYPIYAHRHISKAQQSRSLTSIKKSVRVEYRTINDHILRSVLERVDLAFQAFLDRAKEWNKGNHTRKPGYPRFKSKNRYDSFTTDSYRLKGNKLSFWYEDKDSHKLHSMFGDIKVKLHRPIEGSIKTCTVKREGDHWYVSFSCEVEIESLPVSYEDVGIDMGIERFAAFSTGNEDGIENPRYLQKAEEKLVAYQKVLSRKKKGSNRRKKAVQNVTGTHRKVARQRKDHLHKESRKIVNRFQVIAFEDLKIGNMNKSPKPKQDEETGQYLPNGASAKAGLNKSISDASWGMFRQYCTYKAEWADRTLLPVNPQYTSQKCSACGYRDAANRVDQATFICRKCGICLNADYNAALNILHTGIQSARGRSTALPEQSLSHKQNEAGVASALISATSPKRKRQKSGAESLIPSPLSQQSLWDST